MRSPGRTTAVTAALASLAVAAAGSTPGLVAPTPEPPSPASEAPARLGASDVRASDVRASEGQVSEDRVSEDRVSEDRVSEDRVSEVMTLRQAAAFLQLEPRHLADLARAGQVPARDLAKQGEPGPGPAADSVEAGAADWRFSRAALLAWLAGGPAVRHTAIGAEATPKQQRDAAAAMASAPAAAALPEPEAFADRPAPVPAAVGEAEHGRRTAQGANTRHAPATAEPAAVGVGFRGRQEDEDMVDGDGAFRIAGARLSSDDMAAVRGRGPGGREPPSDTATAASGNAGTAADGEGDGSVDIIGERPQAETAEQVALRRERVLLRRGEMTLEGDLFYTAAEEQTLLPSPAGFNVLPAVVQERDIFSAGLTARYGLIDDVQVVASTAVVHDTSKTTIGLTEQTSTDTRIGDVFLAARYAAIKEGHGYPDTILSLEGRVPVDDLDNGYSVGGSVAFVKSLDPVALFARVRYLRSFGQEGAEPFRLYAENLFDVSLGYAFAINDTLSLSTELIGLFTTRTETADVILPARQQFALQLGLTSLLGEGLYIEPTVAFALNGPPSVTVGLSAPFSFFP